MSGAAGALWLGRAGELKTCWTKAITEDAYGDCCGGPFDRSIALAGSLTD
jgi:hypothetical protein